METHRDSARQTPPDFYETFARGQSAVTLDTTDRLFKLVEPARGWPQDVVHVSLADDESVPEELRGVGLTLGLPRGGNGPRGASQLSMMSRGGEFAGQVTELLASRVIDYIEEERTRIFGTELEDEDAGERFVRQRRELASFLESIGPRLHS